MDKKPLLSIVIPTKDRQKYCLSAIDSILNIQDDRIQIVIQDNSSNKSLYNLIPKNLGSNILKYNYNNKPMSFVDNFNEAIDIADGEYICIIGDDDGINPQIIEATQWAFENKVESLVGNIKANYRWEETGAKDTFFTKMTGSTLTITHFDSNAKYVDLHKSLKRLMLNGCTNYLDFELPKLYHGIVKKSALNRIKLTTGAYLKGLSPDIYASIALACSVKSLVYIDYPLTIPGVCAESGSIKEGQIKKHSKNLEDAPHFKGRSTEYSWDTRVPRIYCVQTIWADSAFSALKEFNRDDLVSLFDKYMLCSHIIYADPSLKDRVYDYLNDYDNFNKQLNIQTHWNLLLAFLKGPGNIFIKKRAIGRIKKILKIERYKIINNLDNIDSATKALQDYLKDLDLDFMNQLNRIKR